MTRMSYNTALNKTLKPLGFKREGKNWVRVRGDMRECVNLQTSTYLGTTANLYAKDLKTEKLLGEALSTDKPHLLPETQRIGGLIDGHDRWWRRDPNGPASLAQAVGTFGVPWFDKVRTLEDQAELWYGRYGGSAWWRGPPLIYLALTLYRMGCLDEALTAIRRPVPRTAIPSWVANVAAVREWLERKASGNN